MQKFLAVLDEALQIVRKDPKLGAAALGSQAGLDPADALAILNLGKQIPVKDMREPLSGSPLALLPAPGEQYAGHVKAVKEMADFLYKNGNIPKQLPWDEVVRAHAPEYLQAYVSAQK
jgi:ABC-type nitrate/sulfonate/bicarbonate transport system substrate-binding protein